MHFYTIVTTKKVYRVRGKSIQQVTQACHSVGIKFLSIYEDQE